MHPDEWKARVELAAAYRIFDMLGWAEMIYNHITARIPGTNTFLLPTRRSPAEAATNLAWLPLAGAASEIARIRLERRAAVEADVLEQLRHRIEEVEHLARRISEKPLSCSIPGTGEIISDFRRSI